MVLRTRRDAGFEVFHRKDDVHGSRVGRGVRRGDRRAQLQRLIGPTATVGSSDWSVAPAIFNWAPFRAFDMKPEAARLAILVRNRTCSRCAPTFRQRHGEGIAVVQHIHGR